MSLSEKLLVREVPFDESRLRKVAAVCQQFDSHPPFSDYTLLGKPSVLCLMSDKTLHNSTGSDFFCPNPLDIEWQITLGIALVNGNEAEMVIIPGHRKNGYGTYFLNEIRKRIPGDVKFWAHGAHPAALALAKRYGATEERVVCIMHLKNPRARVKSLLQSLSRMRWIEYAKRVLQKVAFLSRRGAVESVTYRCFRTGRGTKATRDEIEWLALNAEIFKDHPEYGKLTINDLRLCYSQPWFSRKRFILAIKNGKVAGYVWIKLNKHSRKGEIYSLGSTGGGLGSKLLERALDIMYRRGVELIFLYVDETNKKAINLYRKFNFAEVERDILFNVRGGR
ncbi:GNAT family N-acetyltransferase [Tropheryma whipplei]|uniref:Acetyltransferase n=1 Tax=Tropheryma whipplei (strain Twist) TaxID=203267 RepID=Q83FQ3_TROWT|nr:GNAT family N-acetyltransferase [Tropheryma whipplei]AAO44756.1 acetyltransferase [Tropheryma whipplei str. Twist]MCO8182896.1 GNAT family N-acetyltransferase [Tropheryma whipplei]MCO8190612.1 GNAT family N-acetyltransferase [Tropheryma whipplei]